MKFVGLVGSNDQSYNCKLMEFIRFANLKSNLNWKFLKSTKFQQPTKMKMGRKFPIRLLYNKITRADGVIIATPEHNHTISAALSLPGVGSSRCIHR